MALELVTLDKNVDSKRIFLGYFSSASPLFGDRRLLSFHGCQFLLYGQKFDVGSWYDAD